MYAVIKTGGKQYRVVTGETLKIETVSGEVGSAIVLDKVLMVGNGEKVSVGQPLLAGAYCHGNHNITMVVARRLESSRCADASTTKSIKVIVKTITEIRIDGISA